MIPIFSKIHGFLTVWIHKKCTEYHIATVYSKQNPPLKRGSLTDKLRESSSVQELKQKLYLFSMKRTELLYVHDLLFDFRLQPFPSHLGGNSRGSFCFINIEIQSLKTKNVMTVQLSTYPECLIQTGKRPPQVIVQYHLSQAGRNWFFA